MKPDVFALGWPATRLGEVLHILAREVGSKSHPLAKDSVPNSPPPRVLAGGIRLIEDWIESTGQWLGIETTAVSVPYSELGLFFKSSAPALVHVTQNGEACYLALVEAGPYSVYVLTPQFTRVRVTLGEIRQFIVAPAEAPWLEDAETVLDEIGLKGRRRSKVRAALLREYLGKNKFEGCWLVRSSCSGGLLPQARENGLIRLLAGFVLSRTLAQVIWISSWYLLGGMILAGYLDSGRLSAWLLLLTTLIPVRLFASSQEGHLAIRAGAIIKRRLLFGALRMDPDEVRHMGMGELLGRVMESDALESLALTGGFLGVTATFELIGAGIVMALGAGGFVQLAIQVVMVLVVIFQVYRYRSALQNWTVQRLSMTNDLVELMIGHRTRLAQQPQSRWHDGEDTSLADYHRLSKVLDGRTVSLEVLVPRLWLIVGFLGLLPALLGGQATPESLAVGTGGLLLAYQAFRNLAVGLQQIAGAAIVWERISPFWKAAMRPEPIGDPQILGALASAQVREVRGSRDSVRPADRRRLLQASDLFFKYPNREDSLLKGVGVSIFQGDRLLLEGPSGGGKSTLAKILAGSSMPSTGLLLLDGLDRETLGAEGWRRRVVLVPQFHENYVFTGTFAFNLLMGRGWPARTADLERAEAVCVALGLGPLLDRMPARMLQLVGETGWQLSHGEKSRLYIARAYLQGAEILILDESLAALDPQTLGNTLQFVLDKAPAFMLIAHP